MVQPHAYCHSIMEMLRKGAAIVDASLCRRVCTHDILYAPVVEEEPIEQCFLSFLLKPFLIADVSWKENV